MNSIYRAIQRPKLAFYSTIVSLLLALTPPIKAAAAPIPISSSIFCAYSEEDGKNNCTASASVPPSSNPIRIAITFSGIKETSHYVSWFSKPGTNVTVSSPDLTNQAYPIGLACALIDTNQGPIKGACTRVVH